MNWQNKADANWTNARAKQWLVAMIVTERAVRVGSDDTMTQLRGAWYMYRFIRQYYPAKARELRKRYGYSRFYEVYKLIGYDLSPDDCVEFIESNMSNAAMVEQIKDIHDPRDEWERKSILIYKSVDKFTHVNYGAPEWFTDWAKSTRDLFREKGIK